MTLSFTNILLAVCLMASFASAEPTADLIKSVSQSPEWLRLLHYRSHYGNKEKSDVDGEGFFFSPDGKRNPEAELLASLKAFQSNSVPVGKMKQLPTCAFPERSRFIKEKMQLEFPAASCSQLEAFIGTFHNPQSASLVFSSAYPNNPASMFGHTFLKINSDRATDLLDTGVNFAAFVPPSENGLAFAYFGIFGGYLGQWSTEPYYVKVAEYVNFESRDLWEYQLALSPEETRRLLNHIWEIETNSNFDYFFFDENCSYQVLAALEAVRPDWNFLNKYHLYLIPGESVKHAVFEPGVVKEIKFRPSLYKKMWQKYSVLTKEEQKQFQQVMALEIAPSKINSRLTMEALSSHMDYLRGEDSKNYEKTYKPLQTELLAVRAGLGPLSKEEEDRIPALTGTTRPDLGHDSYALELGVGHRDYENSHQETFSKLKIKTSYHDLMNKDLGYTPFAKIDFPWIELQYNDYDHKFKIEQVTAIATTSLTPVNALRTPISFHVDTGLLTSREFASCYECNQVYAEVGGGLTFANYSESLLAYGFLLARADVAGHLEHGFGYGPGGEFGLLTNPWENYKGQLALRTLCDFNYFGDCRQTQTISLNQSFSLGRNHELRNFNKWVQPDPRVGTRYLELGLSYIKFF